MYIYKVLLSLLYTPKVPVAIVEGTGKHQKVVREMAKRDGKDLEIAWTNYIELT